MLLQKKKKGKKAEFKPKMLDKTPKFISTALSPGILVSGALNDRLDLWPPQSCVPRDGKCSTLVAGLVFPGYFLCKSQTEAVWKITWMPWSNKLKEKMISLFIFLKQTFQLGQLLSFMSGLCCVLIGSRCFRVTMFVVITHINREKNLNNSLCFGLFWLNVAL